MIITFCGHSKFYVYQRTEEKLLFLLDEPVGELFVGGYGGFDDFVLGCAKKYRLSHPSARIILITPYSDPSGLLCPPFVAARDFDGIVYPELEDKPQRFAITYATGGWWTTPMR